MREFYKADTDVRPDTAYCVCLLPFPQPAHLGLTLVQIAAAVWFDNALGAGHGRYLGGRDIPLCHPPRIGYLENTVHLDYKQRVRRWI